MCETTTIRPDEQSTELHPYSLGPNTLLSPRGWPPILDLSIFKMIPVSIPPDYYLFQKTRCTEMADNKLIVQSIVHILKKKFV
jgi:hypothetical protein